MESMRKRGPSSLNHCNHLPMWYMKNISLQQPRMMDQVQFLIATTLQVDFGTFTDEYITCILKTEFIL